MGYYSKTYTGSWPGPEELKLYWLNYILKNFITFIDKRKTEKELIKIITSSFEILKKYSNYDFFSNQKFNVTHPGQEPNSIIFRVPHRLNKLELDLSIKVFEEITNSHVSGISLIYSKYEYDVGQMNYEIQVQIEPDNDPIVERTRYDQFPFTSNEKWCFELPEFRGILPS